MQKLHTRTNVPEQGFDLLIDPPSPGIGQPKFENPKSEIWKSEIRNVKSAQWKSGSGGFIAWIEAVKYEKSRGKYKHSQRGSANLL